MNIERVTIIFRGCQLPSFIGSAWWRSEGLAINLTELKCIHPYAIGQLHIYPLNYIRSWHPVEAWGSGSFAIQFP